MTTHASTDRFDEPDAMREVFLRLRPRLQFVTLRFYGEWFGRPLDNAHGVRAVDVEGDRMILSFDQNETLEIDRPRGLSLRLKRKLRDDPIALIATARSVTWNWYAYEKSRVVLDRYYIRYEHVDAGLSITSNVTWYAPGKNATSGAPAIALY